MGCTRAEFVRWLPAATGDPSLQIGDDRAIVHAGDVRVEIAFTALPPRRIALLSLPVLEVAFRFSGAKMNDYRAFLDRFDLYTRRGGG